MKPLDPITREELERSLERAQHGEDLGRRQREPSILERYFRERRRQWALVREVLRRMENVESPVSVICSCVALKRWGDGDDRVAVLRPPPGYTANRHCAICRGTGAVVELPEENP
jgi:hypothetical protein